MRWGKIITINKEKTDYSKPPVETFEIYSVQRGHFEHVVQVESGEM